MQERFEKKAEEGIDDILRFEPSKVSVAKNLASRPTTSTTRPGYMKRPSTRGDRPHTAAAHHPRQSSLPCETRPDTQEIISVVQAVAKRRPPSAFGENLTSLLANGQRKRNHLSRMKSDLFSGKMTISPKNIDFGSKCPIPVHTAKRSQESTTLTSTHRTPLKSSRSMGFIKRPARPGTAGSRL